MLYYFTSSIITSLDPHCLDQYPYDTNIGNNSLLTVSSMFCVKSLQYTITLKQLIKDGICCFRVQTQ